MKINIAENYGKKIYPNREGKQFDMIVNHITDGSFTGSVNWLSDPKMNPDSSAHFVVSRDGRVTQIAELKDGAWANGAVDRPTSKLVKERPGINPNLYTVSIEHEGFYNQTGGALTEAQYQATLELHKWIINGHKALYGKDFVIDRDHIIGHYEISSINKVNCPGKLFPWDRLIKDLQAWANPMVAIPTASLDRAQQWSVDNGILADKDWDKPITKAQMAWIMFSFLKRVIEAELKK